MGRISLVILLLAATLFGNELGDFLRQAEENHPALVAQRAVLEQLYQQSEEVKEFLDPSLYAGAGGSSRLWAQPVSPASYRTPDAENSLEGQAGVLVPIKQGAYLSVGGELRRWFNPDGDYDSMYQHLLGARVKIPLLRDRGFSIYGYHRAIALANYAAGVYRLQDVEQTVRRDVELAYIAFCVAVANREILQDATERFQRIYEESDELAQSKTIPEYQVHTARRDLQIGMEDLVISEQTLSSAKVLLASAVGLRALEREPECSIASFLQAAMELTEMPAGDIETAQQNRGEYQALLCDIEGAQAQNALEEESRKDDVSLNLGVAWKGDSDEGMMSSYRIVTDHHWGGEVMVAWSRPLDYTGTDARRAQAVARMTELKARLEAESVRITAELRSAQFRFEAAQKRMAFIHEAVSAAQATVDAEQERFRLGESTSTIVLDAQKVLNSTLLRQNTVAAELLTAYAELQYALGYPAAK